MIISSKRGPGRHCRGVRCGKIHDPASAFAVLCADKGQILINGIPIEQISFTELHQRIAFLEQDTYLFDATIAENIGIAKPDAAVEEIKTAAKRAGIAEFIETLPDGYDTDMGQMSARLSGGERQRIGIARVLLRNPDVCLMDEPSSALDALHEKELLHTLETEYAGKTLLLISHRASTLTGCERILNAETFRH